MSQLLEIPVISKNGIRGKVLTPSRLLDTRPEKLVIFETGRQVNVPSHNLHLRTNGTFYLDLTVDPNPSATAPRELLPERISTPAEPVAIASAPQAAAPQAGDIVIPRIEEVAEISKRTIETGRVRVEKTAYDDKITIDEPTIYQEYDVQHVPVNEVVTEEAPTRVEGDVTIIPVYEEEVVTTKRLILREEIHLIKKRRVEHAPQTVTLRKESVDVERTKPDSARVNSD